MESTRRGRSLRRPATAAFTLLAAAVAGLLYGFLVARGTEPRLSDFHIFWVAGREYLHGRSPYPIQTAESVSRGEWFVYPAPAAALFAPLGALPYSAATIVMTCVLVAAAGSAFWLVGVRDWRCYTLAFASVALLKALNLGTVTPLLMFAVALVWRLRHRRWPLAAAIAAAVLLKLFLWPLIVWSVATGRRRQAGQALLLTVAASFFAWLPIAGSFVHYPSLLHDLTVREGWSGYGLAGLAAVAGLSHATAALVTSMVLPLCGIVAWTSGKLLSERRSLATTVAISIIASPVVWGHYLALASLSVALASPALGPAWFAALALWATPGQQAWASGWRILLALAVLTVPLVPRPSRESVQPAVSGATTTSGS